MKQYAINLLPKKKNKVADRLLYFVLYYFRYIIVVTQIIVIGVFFFRFKVDQQVIDLKESYKQKRQILAVTVPIVEEAKIIEGKADKVRAIIDGQDLILARTDFILNNIPEDVELSNFKIDENEISMSGTSESILSIRSLHRKISMREGLENAVIKSVDRAGDKGFSFGINITFDQKKKKNKRT